MKIEILAIGDEILFGDVINSNAAYLSKELQKEGYVVDRHTVISDDFSILKKGIQEILKRSDLIIATGGLGGTQDDRTKEVVANLFKRKLILDKKLLKDLCKRYIDTGFIPTDALKFLKSQSYLIQGAHILKNERGTAPGYIIVLEKNKKMFILLPGVPIEMRALFSKAIPFIKKKFIPKRIFRETLNICLKKEVEVEPYLEKLQNKKLNIGIYPNFATTRVSFTSSDKNILQKAKNNLSKNFKEFIYKSEKGSIAEAVQNSFILKKKRLALAESCTGGAIASAITQIPGSSEYFLGSFVSYSNDFKKNILKVSNDTLKTYGAVSLQVVDEMVQGVLSLTEADFALAVSGIAGPSGGSLEKPVGTVAFAVQQRGKKIDKGILHLTGDRELIIKYSTSFALSLIWVKIESNLTYFM